MVVLSVFAALVFYIGIFDKSFYKQEKNSSKINVPQSNIQPNTLKTSSVPPLREIALSTTQPNQRTRVLRKYSPEIMNILSDEMTPPPAIYLIPVDKQELFEREQGIIFKNN